ncbi:hypothetical protein VN97_g11517 [Penicillium thymicola]|uniref:Uncharacterized protein n=1 Tax=Penicillium thymicola TaxID=293382 RepID=A0AAI9X2Y2_PENTH|nr:hypothetical protein VN97_g11517 [Penicillium thymicola]
MDVRAKLPTLSTSRAKRPTTGSGCWCAPPDTRFSPDTRFAIYQRTKTLFTYNHHGYLYTNCHYVVLNLAAIEASRSDSAKSLAS